MTVANDEALHQAAAPFVDRDALPHWDESRWDAAQQRFADAVRRATPGALRDFLLDYDEGISFNFPIDTMTCAYERALEVAPDDVELLRRLGTHLRSHFPSRDEEGQRLLERADRLADSSQAHGGDTAM